MTQESSEQFFINLESKPAVHWTAFPLSSSAEMQFNYLRCGFLSGTDTRQWSRTWSLTVLNPFGNRPRVQ